MSWYKREIKKYSVDMYSKIYSGIILVLSFSLYFYFTKGVYKWEEIEIIPLVPWIRILISALTYVTIGALLYKSKILYKPLYFIFVTILKDKKIYRKIKEIIWIILGLLMYFIFLPLAVVILNKIISLFYNLLLFLFYISPVLVISGFLILAVIYSRNKIFINK